ncbi:MAG: tetratricopeptide repeat protein [Terrimicrobiaceae bacterium]
MIRKVEEAEALEKTGDFRGSETAFAEIIKTNPENDRAWGGLGRSILAAGRYQEASDALDNACRLQVIDGRNFAARGAARRAMNKLKAAYQDFNDAQRLNPRDIQSSLAMLFVAIELEDYGLFDRTMVKLRSTARASQPEWMLAEAAKELHIGENHNAQLLLEKASEGLPPEQYEALLSDRIFADKRSKALIATLGQVVSP